MADADAAAAVDDGTIVLLSGKAYKRLLKHPKVTGVDGQITVEEQADKSVTIGIAGDPTLVPMKVVGGADAFWLYIMSAVPTAAEAADLEGA